MGRTGRLLGAGSAVLGLAMVLAIAIVLGGEAIFPAEASDAGPPPAAAVFSVSQAAPAGEAEPAQVEITCRRFVHAEGAEALAELNGDASAVDAVPVVREWRSDDGTTFRVEAMARLHPDMLAGAAPDAEALASVPAGLVESGDVNVVECSEGELAIVPVTASPGTSRLQ